VNDGPDDTSPDRALPQRRRSRSDLRYHLVSFGRGVWSGANSVVVLPSGKVLVAGWAFDPYGFKNATALVRLLPDRRLDPTFGGDGRVLTKIGTGALDGVPLSHRRVAVVGGLLGVSAVVAYQSDGTRASDLGADGITTLLVEGASLIVDPLGRPAVGDESADGSVAFARLQEDGDLDASFGPGGVAELQETPGLHRCGGAQRGYPRR